MEPVTIFFQEVLAYLVVVQFSQCFLQLSLSSYEICSLVASQLADGASATDKAAQRIDERVGLQGMRYFQVDGSGSHTGEEDTIPLYFFPLLLDNPRTKVIHDAIREGWRWLKSIFR